LGPCRVPSKARRGKKKRRFFVDPGEEKEGSKVEKRPQTRGQKDA